MSLSGVEIEVTKHIKLLGLHIDDKLCFDEHVSKMCKKASFHVSAIGRISKYLGSKSLLKLFHAFIRSNFQYANCIWHFTSNANILKMEKLQRRAIRIVFNDYQSSYKELLSRAKISSLYVSRIKSIVIESFKCIKKLNPEFLHDFMKINDTGYELRDPRKIQLPKTSTTTRGLNSFTFEASKIWNDLPGSIKEKMDLDKPDEFMKAIVNWSGPKCICGSCIYYAE